MLLCMSVYLHREGWKVSLTTVGLTDQTCDLWVFNKRIKITFTNL
jgi:hypothetical protein